jgi:hypothetical protein
MEWKISPGKEKCSSCDQDFQAGDSYFSTLRVTEEELARRDYCPACFETSGLTETDEAETVFWRTRMSDSDPERKRVVDFNILRELFFKMTSQPRPSFASLAYLVGLVLVRKKYLRFVDFVTRDGKDVMRVQRRRGEPCFDVEIPLLDADELAGLKDRLSDLLRADLGDDFDLDRLEEAERESEAESEQSSSCGEEIPGPASEQRE